MGRYFVCLIVFVCVVLMVGCNGEPAERQPEMEAVLNLTGDAQNGEAVFSATTLGEAKLPSCALCHSLEEGKVQTGPSLHGIGVRAETADAEQTAEEYLYYSIVDPNQIVIEPFYSGVMSAQYADALTDQEIADLIAYLKTLR